MSVRKPTTSLSAIIMQLEQIAMDAETREAQTRVSETERADKLEILAHNLLRHVNYLRHGERG